MENKRYAGLTFDIDTLMADLSLKGVDEAGQNKIRKISYSDIVPRLLGWLSELGVKGTFFIIGKDGLDPDNKKAIGQICSQGHEIANHSFSHERRLSVSGSGDFAKDVSESEKILSDIAGRKISGFRMPGSTVNKEKLQVLEELGYLYDSSLNASLVFNFTKACYGFLSGKSAKLPCQGMSSWMAPNRPYYPNRVNIYKDSGERFKLLEIPITLIPGLSFPFMNYFLMASGTAASERCYEMVRSKNRFINLVMHDNEAATWDKFRDFGLSYRFCGWHMKKDIKKRGAFIKRFIGAIKQDYNIITLEEYSRIYQEQAAVKINDKE